MINSNITGWTTISEFSVGGLMWVGFSKRQPNKLLCISSQYDSLVDCDTGEIIECDVDYDEDNCIAVSTCLPDEVVDICGAYGGIPLLYTNAREEISILEQEELFASKTIIRAKVTFHTVDEKIEIHNDYGFYICSFSADGNYFVFAEDAGITIMKRNAPKLGE